MQEIREQEFIDTGRWQEVNRMLEKVTQGDEELTEYLSMLGRANYLTGFVADVDFEIKGFVAGIFTAQLESPLLNYKYKKSMQDIFLNFVALYRFVAEKLETEQTDAYDMYNNLHNDSSKLMNAVILGDSDIISVNDDFDSSELDQFYVFEHEGEKYYVKYIKTLLDKYNELFTDMPKEDKKELNKFIVQVKNIYYNLKFDGHNFEASKIIDSYITFIGENQFHRALNPDFWNNLNSDKINFKNENLSKALLSVKKEILPHLYIKVDSRDYFRNPKDTIPMFKNVDELYNYMNEIRNVLNGLNGLIGEVDEADSANYQALKIELKKYYYFFVDQYLSYVSFNELPTKENIQALRKQLLNSDYAENELSVNEQLRLFDLTGTIDEPNRKKIIKLINSSKDKQKTYRDIIKMILVSDISIETLCKGNKFGYKILKGVIYQEPLQNNIEQNSPGGQKININERLSGYLEDPTGQEYLKRMIFLPDNIDISTAVYTLKGLWGVLSHNTPTKNVEILTEPNNYKTSESQRRLRELLKVINVTVDIFKSNDQNDQIEVIKDLFVAFNSQYLMEKEKLENAKESLNKIKWWHLIFQSNRQRKRQLLSQIDDLIKKQENFVELLSQTFGNLIAYKSNYPKCLTWINEILKSKVFSENLYMLADIINNSLMNVLPAEYLIESIKQISTLREVSNESEQEPDQPKIMERIELNDENKLKLIKFVCKIAQNDLTGLLMKNANEILKLELNGATNNDYKFRVVKNIYKLSKMCPNGAYPILINMFVEGNDTNPLPRIDKLHKEITKELDDKESPLQILAKINSEGKQNQQNQKISTR